MTKIDGNKVIGFLAEKWRGRSCPVCGVGPWNVHNSTFELREFNEGNMVLGGPVIPVIPVICANCGNTVLINAIMAGVMAPEVPPDPGASK